MSTEITNESTASLYTRPVETIEAARRHVAQAANVTMVMCYYQIGRMIVEDEQKGKHRAGYGEKALQVLSERLTERFGKGFSYPNLKRFRQFYQEYFAANAIGSTALSQSGGEESPFAPFSISQNAFCLSWSHYLQLLRVEDPLARRFYEIEAAKGSWSVRWLNRQICSSLYERVALSKDKDSVMELSSKGSVVTKPQDVLKEPYVLEFLGMKAESSYTETELEGRLISHLQEFFARAWQRLCLYGASGALFLRGAAFLRGFGLL